MRQLKITQKITDRESSKSFNQYLFDLRMIKPFNNADEEFECAMRAYNGDESAVEELIKRNLKFVVSVAKQYASPKAPLNELINEGNLGLIEAARKFEPTRGFKFISYAVWYIRKNISDYFNNSSNAIRIPVNKINKLNKLKKEISIMEQINERPVSSCDFIDGEKGEFNINNVSTLLEINSINIGSFDSPFNSDDDSGTMLDILEDVNSLKSDSVLISSELNNILENAMSNLDNKQRDIIILSYGLFNEEPLSVTQISERINVKSENVRQTKQKALKIMKINMRKRGIKLDMLLN